MKENEVIYDIKSLPDCKNIGEDVKYVTIDIKNINYDVISYLINNKKEILFTERIDNKRGYVYVDYDTFIKGQIIIDNIINEIPKNLNKLETARYLYIKLGKIVGNELINKYDYYLFNNINSIGNIWHSLVNGKISNITLAKTYLYLCSLFDINCEIIKSNNGEVVNKIYINDNNYIVNLNKDLWLIQAGFATKYFASYNNEIDIDKKIGYVNQNYNDIYIDRIISSIDFMDENMLGDILIKTQGLLNVDSIKPVELAKIYNYIFNKYCPDYNITINNLFINNEEYEHFILISFQDKRYSYNYQKKSFAIIDNDILKRNLDNKKIELSIDEFIPNLRTKTIAL